MINRVEIDTTEMSTNWNYDFQQAPHDGTLLLMFWDEKANPRRGGYELRAIAFFDVDFKDWDSDDRIAEKLLNEMNCAPTKWMVWPE